MPSIRRLLIANRGEIAVRIARTARSEGIETVVAHAEDDAGAPFVLAADAAQPLPGTGPAAYLSVDGVVAAAQAAGCDAVHPGYGFLSENPALAEACREAGLTFVGPTVSHVETFGDKLRGRAAAEAAGVPVLAATAGATDLPAAEAFFDEHGPLMVKAVAGAAGGACGWCERAPSWPKRWPPVHARPPLRSGTMRSTWRSCSPAPATSRCRSSATASASSTCTSATAPSSAGGRR